MRLNRGMRMGAVVGALGLATLAWAGCGGKAVTEYVAGFSTQVQVPRDLQTIIIRVDVGGQNILENYYPVYQGGVVRLPRTLGIVNDGTPPGTPITVTVYGYSVPGNDPDYSVFSNQVMAPTVGSQEASSQDGTPCGSNAACGAAGNGGARVLRSSRQPYVQGQIIYLPMPIHYSCYDVDCGPKGQGTSEDCLAEASNNGACTCVAGQCVLPDNPNVSPDGATTTLPSYSDTLIYGSTNTCFRPFTDTDPSTHETLPGCMDVEVAPQPVGDPSDCIFAIPTTASAAGAGAYQNPDFPLPLVEAAARPGPDGPGLNVRVVFDNLVSEVLDYEGVCPAAWPPKTGANPQEGYCNYADAPQKFRLAPGLCQEYLGQNPTHQITLLEANAYCPSKTEFQPICDDTVQGAPQPTLIDGGQSADGICNASNVLEPAKSALYILFDRSNGMRDFLGSTGLAEVLGLSLTDPVFQQTQVALMYTPALQSDCASSSNEFEDVLPDAGSMLPSGTIPFEAAGLAQGDIANSLLYAADAGAFPSDSSPWYLEAALAGAYGALQGIDGAASYNRRAVMLFYDRDFNVTSPDCSGHQNAIEEAQAALAQQVAVETYVVYLANADYPDGAVPGQAWEHGQQLAQGLSSGGQYAFNAANGATAQSQAALALANVVADLGSCVYEVPLHFVPGVDLSFPNYAKGGASTSVSYASDCLADDGDTHRQYVFDNQHIRICQNTCKVLVQSIVDDEIVTAQQNQGATTPRAPYPIDVTWGYACGSTIPDASIVESGTAPVSATDAGLEIDADLPAIDAGP